MQLLKISTTPIKYQIQSESAALKPQNPDLPKMTLDSVQSKVNINTESTKIRMDSSEMFNSLGRKSPADLAKESFQKSNSTANSVTAEYVRMGNQLAKNGTKISDLMKNKSLSNTTINTTIASIPSSEIDISWEPSTVDVDVSEASVDTQWQIDKLEMEYIPGKCRLEILQYADVDIEYLGGIMYVPPSSDPDNKNEDE